MFITVPTSTVYSNELSISMSFIIYGWNSLRCTPLYTDSLDSLNEFQHGSNNALRWTIVIWPKDVYLYPTGQKHVKNL